MYSCICTLYIVQPHVIACQRFRKLCTVCLLYVEILHLRLHVPVCSVLRTNGKDPFLEILFQGLSFQIETNQT